MPLSEYVPDQLWLQEYPIHFAGCDFNARMAVIRVSDTEPMIHSPCEIDPARLARRNRRRVIRPRPVSRVTFRQSV